MEPVRDRRITEVGVLLPLSQRQDLPTFYETRHRAAAGLAERTDALVVAVSEERGRVSVAKDNCIKSIVQSEDLTQILKMHMNISEKAKVQGLKRERLRFFFAAACSLIVITEVWFGFTRNQDTIITLNVPVEYGNRPSNLEIIDTSINQVHLQLKGPSAFLKTLRPDQVEVRIDLRKAVEGKNSFPLTRDNIALPPGVLLSKVNPSAVDITLEKPITKELPVQVNWVGRLPDNWCVTDVKVTPETIRVIGGIKILENTFTIYAAPVRLENLSRSGAFSVPVVIVPPSLKLESGSKDRIVIKYTLGDRQESNKQE